MNDFGKRFDGPGGRRIAARDPVLLSASIITLQSAHVVELLNVSETGAKIRCGSPLRVGQDVWIKSPPVNSLAEVKWVRNGMSGLHFDEPLSGAQLRHLQELGKWTLITKMTPQEQQAAEDWASGMAR